MGTKIEMWVVNLEGNYLDMVAKAEARNPSLYRRMQHYAERKLKCASYHEEL